MPKEVIPAPPAKTHEELKEIESSPSVTMCDSSASDLLQELISKRKRKRILPYALLVFALAVCVVAAPGINIYFKGFICLLAVAFVVYAGYSDKLKKTTVLFYELDPTVEAAYQCFHDSFKNIQNCSHVWRIEAEGRVKDTKYHAGAHSLVQKKTMKAAKRAPKFVETNLDIPMLPFGKHEIYFFPDRALIFREGDVGEVYYNSLKIGISQTRFVEEGSVPTDSKVVDYTWRFVNKDGGPDRRFKNNRQLPIALYENVSFSSASGLNELIQVSCVGTGAAFRDAVISLSKCAAVPAPSSSS